MKQDEAIKFAVEYLCMDGKKDVKLFKLHRSLQFNLCRAYGRLNANFGEVTKRDVAYIVESWTFANSNNWERMGWDMADWRQVCPLISINDNLQPTETVISQRSPLFAVKA